MSSPGGSAMYRRDATARQALEGKELTRAMVGIGMVFAAEPSPDANLEDTVLAASEEGMERDDLRVLGVLVDWLDIYHPWLNADRLVRLVQDSDSARVHVFWCAFAQRHGKDRRFARLLALAPSVRDDLLRAGTEFQVRRRGEDARFEGTALRVPGGALRERPADVLSPSLLAKQHRAYRWRAIIGPTYRANRWAR